MMIVLVFFLALLKSLSLVVEETPNTFLATSYKSWMMKSGHTFF